MAYKLTPLESAGDVQEVGGKAANLGRLIKAGLSIPAGFVLSGDTGIDAGVDEILSRLDAPLIVRSSATIEDAVMTSFAGQFESFYPIGTRQELADAVLKVQASRTSEKISKYLDHYNISSTAFKVAAIVQEYKTPVWSGVVFIDDSTATKKLIIEMSAQAEGVVSGKEAPIRFTVEYATKRVLTKSDRATEFKGSLDELIGLSIAVGDAFRRPQDIEWVHDGKRFWIVQSRPITASVAQASGVVEEESRRLEAAFGAKPPHFVAHQFAEGLEYATPLTTDLFRKFYSPEGSLGRVMRSYLVPFKAFDPERYVVDILGRLFLNKDCEKDFLFSRIPRRPVDASASSLAMPLYQTKWYYPGFMGLLKMLPSLVALYVGDAKFQMDAFRNFNGLENVLKKRRAEKTEELPPSPASARRIVGHLVDDSTPLLFRISLFQQFALSYLERKIKPHVEHDEWQALITTGVSDRVVRSMRREDGDTDAILKEIGHRGFQELELSRPRWAETPDKLFRSVERLKSAGKKSDFEPGSIGQRREKIIGKFPDVWDQQMIAVFFGLYDRFSLYREEMHDLWVKELTSLRKVLLHLDRGAGLYNHIWYAALDEALADEPKFDLERLAETRRRHEIMRKIPLKGDIQATTWTQITESPIPAKQGKTSVGFGLTSGSAEGSVGTIEMLDAGESVDILLLKHLDPAVTIYFESIKGVITEVGGQLAHAAIIAREYGLPIVTLENATGILREGMRVRMDCSDGNVIIL